MKKQVKEIFQIKVSKSEKQKCLAAEIQRVTVQANHDTKYKKANEQL